MMISGIYIWNELQQKQSEREKYQFLMERVVYELQKSVMLDAPEFGQLERQNRIMVYFEEKGKRLTYRNNYGESEEREQLFATVKEKAEDDGLYFKINPRAFGHVKSSVYYLKGQNGRRYLGQARVCPNNSGWYGVILIQDLGYIEGNHKLPVYICIGVLAFVLLFVFSRIFVARTMKPVELAQIKQNEFIAAASHELKSPLAVIKTCASGITALDENSQEFIDGIREECTRMSKLIEDLLLIASAETKSWRFKIEIFALDDLLIQEYEHLSLIVRGKAQELSLALPDEMQIMAKADKSRLLQVLTILLDNASSYSPEKSSIEIGLVREKRHLLLWVSDHGRGISDQEKQHVFERFHRGDKSRSDKTHYGLGLSIGYELVKRMGGTMKVKDTPGGGATFVVELLVP